MRLHAWRSWAVLFGLLQPACGGKAEYASGHAPNGTGGSSGGVAPNGSGGGAASYGSGGTQSGIQTGGAPGFIRIDSGTVPAAPPSLLDAPCGTRFPLVHGGDFANCAWKVPDVSPYRAFQPDHVNIEIEQEGADPAFIYHVLGPNDCGQTPANAWYYDDEQSPTYFALCPQTCATYSSSPGAQLFLVLGCGWGPVQH